MHITLEWALHSYKNQLTSFHSYTLQVHSTHLNPVQPLSTPFNPSRQSDMSREAVLPIMVRIGRTWSEFGPFWENWSEKGLNWWPKVWFSPKLTYLTTHPEFDYQTFILGMNTWQARGSQVVKLFAKRVWFYLIFGPILVWFSLTMRSDLGPNLEIYSLISQLGTLNDLDTVAQQD